jgi:hypothetical protein
MMLYTKLLEYLYQMATGENRKREREQQISRVRDRALDINRNGVGWKWLLVKKDT